ncbi:MAG TPA: polysaccharide biosynthesis protein [Candidatus Acutalibacter pullicola]|uniref:Polysaccharide biosynthesis protein n=1 Tax=Candidatus Acutalibacter pullicola TaxID=2838417 RepID=A0A9D2MWV7_9FIRM|nr:polysaccharide biosynthesis protein [Candidatus Acutalibacter pullicola]
MAHDTKQSFMKGAAILTASTLIVKLLGLLFSIPLANFIDPEGMSHFYIAYNIFGLFLMLSTAGLPVAVSRMVGTATSQGRLREADRVFSVAFWLFFSLGLFGCLVMFFGADQIAQWYGSPDANYAIMALAPTLFFISIESSLRGYFQGRSNMVPTATSQTIEAVTKVIIGVGLAFYIIRNVTVDRDRWAAVGAIIGVSVSAGLGAAYLLSCKFVQSRRDRGRRLEDEEPLTSRQQTLLNLVRFAVPITIGSCFLSLLDTVDGAILMQRLQTGAGFTQEMADWWNGTLGNARKFFDLPGAFVVPISTSLLPILSGAIAAKDQRQVDRISSTALRVTLLIGIPSSVGMAIFARPICQLLLYNQPEVAESAAPLLTMLSLAIAFSGLLFTTNSILQSFGRATRPVVDMAVGGVVKVVLSYVLIGIPEIAAMGSAISTVVSYVVMVVLNLIAIRSSLPHMDSIVKTALPLLLSAGVMGGISYGFYWVLTRWISPQIAVLPAIILAIVVYAVCVVLFRGVSYDDVVMLPKGQTLARLLRMKPEEAPQVLPGEEAAQSLPAAETAPQADPSPRAPVREKRSRRGKYTPRHMR